jgi:hypothetical protein
MANKPSAETPCGKIVSREDKAKLRVALQGHMMDCEPCQQSLVRFYLDDLTAKGEL